MTRSTLQHLAGKRARLRESYLRAKRHRRARRDIAQDLTEATTQLLRAELARGKPARRAKVAEPAAPDLFAERIQP